MRVFSHSSVSIVLLAFCFACVYSKTERNNLSNRINKVVVNPSISSLETKDSQFSNIQLVPNRQLSEEGQSITQESTVSPSISEKGQNAVVFSFSVVRISPIDVTLHLNASHPSVVGCEAKPSNYQFPLKKVNEYKFTTRIQLSAELIIPNLFPNMDYTITCNGDSDAGPLDLEHSKTREVIRTIEPTLLISDIHFVTTSLFYSVQSNVDLPAICILFDDRSTEIDSTKVNLLVSKSVVFMNVDRRKKYFTQCAILRDSNEIIKTDIVSIDVSKRRFSLLSVLVFLVMLCLLVFIFAQLFIRFWQQRKQYTLYDLNDVEKIGLLRRRTQVS